MQQVQTFLQIGMKNHFSLNPTSLFFISQMDDDIDEKINNQTLNEGSAI